MLSKKADKEIKGTKDEDPQKYGNGTILNWNLQNSRNRLDFLTNSAWTIGYTYAVGTSTSYCVVKNKSIPGWLRLTY